MSGVPGVEKDPETPLSGSDSDSGLHSGPEDWTGAGWCGGQGAPDRATAVGVHGLSLTDPV